MKGGARFVKTFRNSEAGTRPNARPSPEMILVKEKPIFFSLHPVGEGFFCFSTQSSRAPPGKEAQKAKWNCF